MTAVGGKHLPIRRLLLCGPVTAKGGVHLLVALAGNLLEDVFKQAAQ